MKQRLRDLEARELWIAARVDELMDDESFIVEQSRNYENDAFGPSDFGDYARGMAFFTACKEHAAIMADLDDERISLAQGGQYE